MHIYRMQNISGRLSASPSANSTCTKFELRKQYVTCIKANFAAYKQVVENALSWFFSRLYFLHVFCFGKTSPTETRKWIFKVCATSVACSEVVGMKTMRFPHAIWWLIKVKWCAISYLRQSMIVITCISNVILIVECNRLKFSLYLTFKVRVLE